MNALWNEYGKQKIESRESNAIWCMKAVAVVAIVACHCTHISDHAGLINRTTFDFFQYWISYGVPVFYFLAGFFLSVDDIQHAKIMFWKKKVETIIIPWICTGTAIWLYIVVRKGGISVENWFGYLFMRESYLYFLTDLCGYYLLFFAFYKKKSCMVGIGVVLTILTIYGEANQINWLIGNVAGHGFPIVNLWLFYIGILARKYMLHKEFSNVRWTWMLLLFIAIRYLQLAVWKTSAGISVNVIVGLCVIISLYSICYQIAEMSNTVTTLGKRSFTIYLLHMPFAGIVANILNQSEKWAWLTHWRPMIVIGMTMVVVQLYMFVVRRKRAWLMLIGMR